MIAKDERAIFNGWMYLFLLIMTLKILILLLDPSPMFFLGDSQTYLSTALHFTIPMDRSFVYGLFIRFVAVASESLSHLVLLQVLLSGLSALIMVFLLIHYLAIRRITAFALGVACALEPLQLLYERYVMTEAVSLFVFALYTLSICHYLKRQRFRTLILAQSLGIVLVSLRLSFLPIIFCFAVVVPLLPAMWMALIPKNAGNRRKLLPSAASSLAISLIATICFHSAYKHINGFLVKGPAAYQYQSGMFLLADFGPVVKPVDFPYQELADPIFSNLKFDLSNRKTRGPQRWMEGGLISNINALAPDHLEADSVAKSTAINALKRDPFGVAMLAVQGYSDYWDLDLLKQCMQTDKGSDRPLPPEMLNSLRDNFHLAAEKLPFLNTFTSTYFFKAWPWYLVLLCLPLIAAVSLALSNSEQRKYLFLFFLASSALVLSASLLIERPTVRYLHPLGWLFFLVVAPLLDRLLAAATGPRHQKELQQ